MPIEAETTEAQDKKLFELAAAHGGGCAITEQDGPKGPIRVNTYNGSKWIVDSKGRALEIKR